MSEMNTPRFCFVETDTAGVTHVAVFDGQQTTAIEHYQIPADNQQEPSDE
jgi:hypothetical protein